MAIKVVVMGLPGAGKTTLSNTLSNNLIDQQYTVKRINADEIRTAYDDWDFSITGRLRQAYRFFSMSENINEDIVVCDFIAPISESIEIFKPDYIIWMDTIKNCRYEDTQELFVNPKEFNIRIQDFTNIDIDNIVNDIQTTTGL